jgi:hypothetical protein
MKDEQKDNKTNEDPKKVQFAEKKEERKTVEKK